ncbi:MAG: nitroreductase family protein [Clostridia bacterium]|nr:nitroreductase family protein [Clostridia bacterium]
MTIKELITASRSYRSFDPSFPISREQLVSFIECARLSPSSRNLQPLKFRLVTDQTECAAMLSSTRWAGLLADMEIPPKGHAPTAYVVICLDTDIASSPAPFQRDVGITAQSILLAATEAGFGGCMIGSFSADAVKLGLSLPENLSPQLVLGLGKPDETVELVELPADGSIAYYRENGVHFVPKRDLEELIV